MEVSILAVGRLKSGPERELCDRYLDRARVSGRRLGFRGLNVVELAESRAGRASDRIAGEAEALVAALPKIGRIVVLDAQGELLESEAFAAMLSSAAAAATDRITFIIGGPDGLAGDVLSLAASRISFGRVTWPHQIVRILLAEQVYRAMTILSGHPYHRA
ncbi:MAG: 23S rRNA (pseudouridine(1915)-N(3))-methyltransferase RlmH [Rhizobiales bacterium]|nr:23S rRNA (pseudouridine(1915)-N(3))-methyltransferase RlmH [Hyphomicrobiales bacterium]